MWSARTFSDDARENDGAKIVQREANREYEAIGAAAKRARATLGRRLEKLIASGFYL
jgi:DNA-binding Lrp family transcriptional regulator